MTNKNINIEYQNYKNLFYEKFESDILPIYNSLEPKRKKALIKFLGIFTPMALMCIATFINMFLYPEDTFFHQVVEPVLIFLFGVGMFAASFIPYGFTGSLKAEFIPKLLKSIGDITWNNGGLQQQELEKSELFPLFLGKISDDCFSGVYKGVKFTVDELILLGDGGGTVYKGVVVAIDSNKKTCNKTIITDKNIFATRNNHLQFYIFYLILLLLLIPLTVMCFLSKSVLGIFFGIWCLVFIALMIIIPFKNKMSQLKENVGFEELENVQLEDSEFEKKYSVYSSDQVEARYLVTTAFMERFKNLQTAFNSTRIKCSFVNDKIYFAIQTNKNLFEIGNMFKSLENRKTMETFFNEIISIYLLIDYFKLNENIGI